MKKNFSSINLIIDKSGSMRNYRKYTIEGINALLQEQASQNSDNIFSIYQFSDNFERTHFSNVKDIKLFTEEDYFPQGSTALFDALGTAISDMGEYFSKMKEEDRPDRVLFVVITDGNENDSKNFSGDKVSEMVKHQSEKYSWEFIFMGTTANCLKDAETLSIARSFKYDDSIKGTRELYTTLSTSISDYRAGANADVFNALYKKDSQ